MSKARRAYLFILLGLFVLFNSCESHEDQSGADIIPEDQMVSLIKETMLVEAHLNEIRVDQIYIKDSAENYYAEVFKRYNTTKDKFENSLEFYSKKPHQIDSMYASVLDQLLEMEVKLDAVQINTENIQPIGKNIVADIIFETSYLNSFLNDSISDKTKVDSLSFLLKKNDSLLKAHKTNLSSFTLSLNNIMHNHTIQESLIQDLENKMKKDTIDEK